MDHDLAFVVDDAASPHATFANRRLERRRDPLRQRIDRLHVVMSVDEQRGLAGRVIPFRENRGMTFRRPHLDLVGTERGEMILQMLRVRGHVLYM